MYRVALDEQYERMLRVLSACSPIKSRHQRPWRPEPPFWVLACETLSPRRVAMSGGRARSVFQAGRFVRAEVLLINSLLAVRLCGRGRAFPVRRACSGSGGAERFWESHCPYRQPIARLWCWRSSHCRKTSAQLVTPSCLPATRLNRLLLERNPPRRVIRAVGPHCDTRVRRYGFCGDSQ